MPVTSNRVNYETKEKYQTVEYVGAVLAKWGNSSYQIMSDIWGTADMVLVWNETKQVPEQFPYNVYDMNGPDWVPNVAEVDATEEVKKKYWAYKFARFYSNELGEATARARVVEKGDVVHVARGKYSKGSTGKVVVILEKPYNSGYRSNLEKKYGIALDDEMIQVAAANGKVYDNHKNMVWAWGRNCDKLEIKVDLEEVGKEARRDVEKHFKAMNIDYKGE